MTKLKLAILVALALLVAACMPETFDGRTAIGLGPTYSWQSAGVGASAACASASVPAASCWYTDEGVASFVATGASSDREIHEDLYLAGQVTDEDMTVSVTVEDLRNTTAGSEPFWTAVALGARLAAPAQAGESYTGYVVELARTNLNPFAPVEPGHEPCSTDPWEAGTVSTEYGMLILYRADADRLHCEDVLARFGHAIPAGALDSDGELSITVQQSGDEECGQQVSASYSAAYVDGDEVVDGLWTVTACDETYDDGRPGLYGFVITEDQGSANQVVVDDFQITGASE